MKIEAIITCHNYADFLAVTLPENLQHLDAVVVVTAREDKKTKALCDRFGVDCVDTNVFFEKGDKFNKGRGINLGLSHLRHDGWLLHIDADILLPHRFRSMLDYAKLNPINIYGADRVNCLSYEHFEKHRSKTIPQWNYGYLVYPPREFHIGARLLHGHYGYCPIGYFQLWHSSQKRRYPINQGSAEHTDVLFSLQWDREHRILLPELFVFHLESEGAKFGENWLGRKSKPYCPEGK